MRTHKLYIQCTCTHYVVFCNTVCLWHSSSVGQRDHCHSSVLPSSCTGCSYLTCYVHKTEICVSTINFVKVYDLYTVILNIRAWTQERLKEGALATNHLFGPGGLEEQGHYHTEGVEEQYELMQKGYAIAIKFLHKK